MLKCWRFFDIFIFKQDMGYVKYQKLKMLISRLKIKISNKRQRLSTDNILI